MQTKIIVEIMQTKILFIGNMSKWPKIYMYKKGLFIILFCILFRILNAQEISVIIPSEKHFGFGAGFSKTSVNEHINTSIPYSGSNSGIDILGVFNSGKHIFQFKNVLIFGTLSPYKSESNNANSIDSYYGNLVFSYLWNVYSDTKRNLYYYAGPSLGAKLGFRFNNGELGNSAFSYEGAASVSLTAKISKHFNFLHHENSTKRFKAEVQLMLPCLSKVYTPSYLGFAETALTENPGLIDFSSNYLGYLSNYFNLETNLSLTYYLKNRNAIEVAYFWDYLSTSPDYNPAKTLNSMLTVKLLFNLSK